MHCRRFSITLDISPSRILPHKHSWHYHRKSHLDVGIFYDVNCWNIDWCDGKSYFESSLEPCIGNCKRGTIVSIGRWLIFHRIKLSAPCSPSATNSSCNAWFWISVCSSAFEASAEFWFLALTTPNMAIQDARKSAEIAALVLKRMLDFLMIFPFQLLLKKIIAI